MRLPRPQDQPLIEYLRRHDVPCPRCGYSLHRLRRPYCPECGYGFDLDSLMAIRGEKPYFRVLADDLLEGQFAWLPAMVVNFAIAVFAVAWGLAAPGRFERVFWLMLAAMLVLWRTAARDGSDLGLDRFTRLLGLLVWATTALHLLLRVVL